MRGSNWVQLEARLNSQNARKPASIDADELIDFSLKRETLNALKRRYESLELAVKATEADLIRCIDSGSILPNGHSVTISEKAIRHVSWRSEFCAIIGNEAAEAVLKRTEPTIYRSLVFKKAA